MRKQKCISGSTKNMTQGTLVKLSPACSKKANSSEKRPEFRYKEKSSRKGKP